MEHRVKIKSIDKLTPDVVRIVTEKPEGFTFVPGQATEISLTKEAWRNEGRPFTFTSLPTDDYLEFVIKIYPYHFGVTNQLLHLIIGDTVILHDVFGDIAYKGEGLFLAGGAGITPFISIFRHLQSNNGLGNNKLIYANKTKMDIILKEEFDCLLNKNFINILSNERTEEFAHGFITEDFIKKNMPADNGYYYLCGPPYMMDAVGKQLIRLGIDEAFVIKEGS